MNLRREILIRVGDAVGNPRKRELIRALTGSARERSLVDGRSVPAPGHEQLTDHLESTLNWLRRAHDATPDDGVSAWFDLQRGEWAASYPETTGYIVPTFLALARVRGSEELRDRALRMSGWESDVQMADGAVLSGTLGVDPVPAVFNTGQVLFGWVTAFQEAGRERDAVSASRAADWLVERLGDDGAWRGALSSQTTAEVHAFNGRCAWSLALAAEALGEPGYREAAIAASDWVLSRQNEAGWFADNGFGPAEVPLLHTIVYVLEGLLGTWRVTGEARFRDAVVRAVDALVPHIDAGTLRGRHDDRWRPTVPWRCCTGDAQLAVILRRLEGEFPGRGYGSRARQLTGQVMAFQRAIGAGGTGGPALASAGGVPGSFPVWGFYMRLALPNWAAKFHLDALMLESLGVDEASWPA